MMRLVYMMSATGMVLSLAAGVAVPALAGEGSVGVNYSNSDVAVLDGLRPLYPEVLSGARSADPCPDKLAAGFGKQIHRRQN